jgi:hypothetical protein
MKYIRNWVPAAFCAFISILPLLATSIPDAGWWKPVFFSFLPMCFFFVGSATFQSQREIGELRQKLAELEQKKLS